MRFPDSGAFRIVAAPVMILGTWYGMNFKSIPELDWKYGYAYALTLTVLSTALTIIYFKRKKWL